MIQKHYLRFFWILWIWSDHDIPWMCITMDKAMHEYHLCEYVHENITYLLCPILSVEFLKSLLVINSESTTKLHDNSS